MVVVTVPVQSLAVYVVVMNWSGAQPIIAFAEVALVA